MSRRGMGVPQVEGDFMDLLTSAGLGVQEARLALSNPAVAEAVIATIKREAKSNVIAQTYVENHEPYTLDRLNQVFLAGVTDAYGSPTTWKDTSIDSRQERHHIRTFVAKRYKKTVVTAAEIIESFRAIGYRPANLHEACAYLQEHVRLSETKNVKCLRDIVLLGTTAIVDGKEYVPYLTVPSAPAKELCDYRLEFAPVGQTWGMGEWFLFARLHGPKTHPPEHIF